MSLLLVAVVVAIVAANDAIGTRVARRRGYTVGGDIVVRCRKGHLFTTIWVPGASLKSVRLGSSRWQHCPVGDHWSMATTVRGAELTDAERVIAEPHRDMRIPPELGRHAQRSVRPSQNSCPLGLGRAPADRSCEDDGTSCTPAGSHVGIGWANPARAHATACESSH
jgi:hypothetical protein